MAARTMAPPAAASSPPPVEWWNRPSVRVFYGVTSAVAMGVSYSRNRSIPWAVAHGLVALPYLAYTGLEAVKNR